MRIKDEITYLIFFGFLFFPFLLYDFEYTDIVLYRDGSIAILEVDRGEEYYYKCTNAKKDFLPEESNDTKIIMMIARKDDNGIKYVRTYIEELISNTLK